MTKTKKIIMVVVGIVVAVGLFYGGVVYGKSHAVSGTRFSRTGMAAGATGTYGAGRTGTGSGIAGRTGTGGGITGSILSVNGQTITVGLASGSSQIIIVSSSTPILETTEKSAASLAVGQNISVSGTANSDGSLTAASIQIRQATSTSAGASAAAY